MSLLYYLYCNAFSERTLSFTKVQTYYSRNLNWRPRSSLNKHKATHKCFFFFYSLVIFFPPLCNRISLHIQFHHSRTNSRCIVNYKRLFAFIVAKIYMNTLDQCNITQRKRIYLYLNLYYFYFSYNSFSWISFIINKYTDWEKK